MDLRAPPPRPLPAAAARLAHGWTPRLLRRMRHRLLLKTLGVSAFTWGFFVLYFHLLRNPAGPVTTMPLTALDQAVPFSPGWLGPYLSLWFYIGIAPGLMMRLGEVLRYGAWAAALCAVGLGCFWLWPNAIPAAIQGGSSLPAFALLHGVDAAGNACPSMHVAVAVFSAPWIDRVLRLMRAPAAMRWLNLAWVLAITYSTMAVKQHVALDVAAGTVLGLAFAALSMRLHPGLWADTALGERPEGPSAAARG